MKNNGILTIVGWVLAVGGLVLAYKGFTGTDLIQTVFGGLEPVVDVVVFGGAGAYKAYWMLTKKKK